MLIAVSLTPDDNDTVRVSCPDLPEVHTFGETEAEALEHAGEAVLLALQGRILDRMEVPAFRRPRKGERFVELGSRVAAKLAVYRAMRARGWRKADLARAMKAPPSDIDRLLNLRFRTSHEALDGALAALGLAAEIKVRSVEAA
ncbi:MAG: type II toxin-antitoxin system HicB family antitoxin [Alphaproteobacteria bacterium]